MSKLEATKKRAKRISVGIIGGAVLLLGIIAIPYPGPGWLIVFAGLGILATEFEWAQDALDYAKGKYDDWQDWLAKQSLTIKIIFWLLTFAVVVLTIWLLNGYGLINDWFHLGQEWVDSPFFK